MQVFYTSPWLPPEWIQAHGLEPRGVWFADDSAFAPLPLAAGVCAFANAVIGLAEKHTDSAVVFTTHCDQLRRGFDVVASSVGARVFLFNLPATWQTAVAQQMFASELERLGRFLVELGGQRPSAGKLMETMARYSIARERLLEAALRVSAREYAEAIARFHWDGSVELGGKADSQAQNLRLMSDPVPLALVGGPLPRSRWQVLEVIERAGGRVVLNATEAGERSLWPAFPPQPERTGDCTSPVNAGLSRLARACLDNCVDVFQRPNTRLYSWLKERLSARKVRGIVLWHYVGCDLWRAEAQPMREAFGLPVLLLDASEAASDSMRQAGRIQAFLEALR